jgi:two-component system alkaline phosphatase synthesis response regulator PhoP
MYAYRILLIEDSEGLATVIRKVLQSSGYEVTWIQAVPDSIESMLLLLPQLIVLDTALLNHQSAKVISEFNEHHFCLRLLLIAHIQELGMATNLSLPPDEYLTKPFGMSDLLQRVRALLRRTPAITSYPTQSQLKYGNLTLDTGARKLEMDGQEVDLTTIEYKVLHLFLSQPRRVFTREELVKTAWGLEYIGEDRAVDHLLSRLRKKMGFNGQEIETIRGVGYRLR